MFELKKELPNIALFGGMPCSMLGMSTPEECVDYAKKQMNELDFLPDDEAERDAFMHVWLDFAFIVW